MNVRSKSRHLMLLLTAVFAVFAAGACRDTVGVDREGGSGSTPPDIDFPSCRYGDPSFEVGLIESLLGEPVSEPVLVDDGILVHRRATGYSNSPNDLEVFRVDPRTGSESQLTANDGDDILLDARDGAYLMVTTDPTTYMASLIYRQGDRETTLLSNLNHRPVSPLEMRSQLVNSQAAAFTYDSEVYLYARGELSVVSDGWSNNTGSFLEGEAVVWAGSDGGDREIVMATPDETRQLTENEVHDWRPMLDGDMVFWLGGNAAMAMNWRTGETTVVDEGPCFASTSADSGRAIFVCAGDDQGPESSTYWLGGRRLVIFEDGSARELISRSGEIMAVDLDAGGVAWVEYPPDSAWDEPYIGAVYYLPWNSLPDAEPYEVAIIGSGCWYCDAYWPPPLVLVDGDVLAWSYGLPQDFEYPDDQWPWYPGGGIGYAVMSSPLICE